MTPQWVCRRRKWWTSAYRPCDVCGYGRHDWYELLPDTARTTIRLCDGCHRMGSGCPKHVLRSEPHIVL